MTVYFVSILSTLPSEFFIIYPYKKITPYHLRKMPPKSKTPKKGQSASRAKTRDQSAEQEERARLAAQIEEQSQKIAKLEQNLKQEQEERNFFQLERDKVHTLYEVAQTQLE